jgi:hypothetical protein
MQDCIRVFQLPLQLLSKNQEQIAGLVFSKEKDRVEVFYAEGKLILALVTPNLYETVEKETKFTLELKEGKWSFGNSSNPEKIYTQK